MRAKLKRVVVMDWFTKPGIQLSYILFHILPVRKGFPLASLKREPL